MSIKSTTRLTRAEAMTLYAELRNKLYGERQLTDYELGEELDRLSEKWAERNGTVCFDNYVIVEHTDYGYRDY